jgi:hypothetical protein
VEILKNNILELMDDDLLKAEIQENYDYSKQLELFYKYVFGLTFAGLLALLKFNGWNDVTIVIANIMLIGLMALSLFMIFMGIKPREKYKVKIIKILHNRRLKNTSSD